MDAYDYGGGMDGEDAGPKVTIRDVSIGMVCSDRSRMED